MRKFEELRQEVYRRGKEKKARIQILWRTVAAMSVPLVICVGLIFLKGRNISSENMAGGNQAPGMQEMVPAENADKEFSMDSIYASLGIIVKVDGQFDGETVDGRVGKFNMVAITEIVNLVYGIREENKGNETGGDSAADSYEDFLLIVTFLNELDEQIAYELTPGKMKELSTGKSYSVTLEESAQLEQWLIKNKMISMPEETTAPEKKK